MANNPFREKFRTFSYDGYTVEKTDESIKIAFNFSIEGLCDFCPSTTIDVSNLEMVNDFDSPAALEIIFSLGMVEAVSYFKAVCPERFAVHCGRLSPEDKKWWKKLWFNGLGEFFYKNSIVCNEEDFIEIDAPDRVRGTVEDCFKGSGINIIPVGGGKDSCVTAELLKSKKQHNMFFTVNDQQARTQCIEASGYAQQSVIRTFRTIDKNLLELNSRGFLNGHTPFSAIVAFLSLYCAYITGAQSIVLSNESSANESNIAGTNINHQYSKSYAFECDFNDYVTANITDKIKYFSLLRPFNELQIAKYFSALPQYHEVFRSCNAGSKKNVWCCKCPKCLFVYGILSPFFEAGRLEEIFGENLLDKRELETDFDGLVGFSDLKPFECVGTAQELRLALALCAKRLNNEAKPLPYLLERFCSKADIEGLAASRSLFTDFNEENNVPHEFADNVGEMYGFVSKAD